MAIACEGCDEPMSINDPTLRVLRSDHTDRLVRGHIECIETAFVAADFQPAVSGAGGID